MKILNNLIINYFAFKSAFKKMKRIISNLYPLLLALKKATQYEYFYQTNKSLKDSPRDFRGEY